MAIHLVVYVASNGSTESLIVSADNEEVACEMVRTAVGKDIECGVVPIEDWINRHYDGIATLSTLAL